MKDLSREERIDREIVRLEQLIAKKDYDFDKEQGKRIKRTFFVASAVIYLIAFMNDAMNHWKDFLEWILVAPMMSGAIMFVSFGVCFYIMNGAIRRVETIAKLEGELNALKFSKYDKE